MLGRPHDHWPHTVLHIAMRGGNKAFVGQSAVQRLVDGQWNGMTFGSSWSLPANARWYQILLHATLWRSIKMVPVWIGDEGSLHALHENSVAQSLEGDYPPGNDFYGFGSPLASSKSGKERNGSAENRTPRQQNHQERAALLLTTHYLL